jgi:hypothetical protein
MELVIQKIAAISFLVIGLSHVIQHRVWVNFFLHWKEKGEVGVFYTAFLHFAFGSLIISAHNIWNGIPIVLTLMGWGWVVKGAIYFLYPKQGLRMLNRLRIERSWEFAVPGAALIAYAGLLAYHIFKT